MLHKPAAVGGEVIRHGGHVEAEVFVVDEVQVGSQARGNEAAIGEAVDLGGFAGLTLHHLFQVEAGAALAVAHPVSEQEGGHAAIANSAAVCTGVTEAVARVFMLQQFVRHREIAVCVVEERHVQHALSFVGK